MKRYYENKDGGVVRIIDLDAIVGVVVKEGDLLVRWDGADSWELLGISPDSYNQFCDFWRNWKVPVLVNK